MRRVLFWVAMSVTLSSPVLAADSSRPEAADSTAAPSKFSDSRVEDVIERLSEEEKTLAKQWMLTEKDWVKYKRVMAGPRGIWSPGLDPITALGVMETDPAERRRYAEIWMKMEAKRAELELAFEVERMAASQLVLGGRPVVNNDKWVQQWNAEQNRRTHEVMLFVEPDCLEDCAQLFDQVLASTGEGARTRLNVYFPSGTSAEEIGGWAQELGIDPDIVKARKVTLNFDRGEFTRFDVAHAELPEVRVWNLKTGDVKRTFKRW